MGETKNENEIELRSEKIREVIGRVPNILVRLGIGIISITILCGILLLFFLPCPVYLEEDIYLYSEPDYFIKTELANSLIEYDSIAYAKQGDEIYRTIQGSDTILSKSPIEGYVLFLCPDKINIITKTAVCKIVPPEIQNIFGITYIPHYKIAYIHKGEEVSVFINSQRKTGHIETVYPILQEDDSHCVKVNIDIKENKLDFVKQMTDKGRVKILISNKPFLRKIFNL